MTVTRFYDNDSEPTNEPEKSNTIVRDGKNVYNVADYYFVNLFELVYN
jgi:hypothetical protein